MSKIDFLNCLFFKRTLFPNLGDTKINFRIKLEENLQQLKEICRIKTVASRHIVGNRCDRRDGVGLSRFSDPVIDLISTDSI